MISLPFYLPSQCILENAMLPGTNWAQICAKPELTRNRLSKMAVILTNGILSFHLIIQFSTLFKSFSLSFIIFLPKVRSLFIPVLGSATDPWLNNALFLIITDAEPEVKTMAHDIKENAVSLSFWDIWNYCWWTEMMENWTTGNDLFHICHLCSSFMSHAFL